MYVWLLLWRDKIPEDGKDVSVWLVLWRDKISEDGKTCVCG